MPQFVLEIGTEEMPARFVPALSRELAALFAGRLKRERLEYAALHTFATPRRITAVVEELAAMQPREEEEAVGPPSRIAYAEDGALTKAGQGFAKSQNVDEASLYV